MWFWKNDTGEAEYNEARREAAAYIYAPFTN